jgi:hypothetical protein
MTATTTIIDANIEVLPAEATEVIQKADLASDTINTLTSSFQGFFEEAREWVTKAKAIEVTDLSQTDKIAEAREMRLKLRKIRTGSEKIRKQLKEDSLRMGRAIDGMHNVLKAIVEPCEAHLKEQEDFIARMADQRREEIAAERREQLLPFAEVCDPESFPLGTMNEDEFKTLLAGAEARQKQLVEAKEQAEKERIEREKKEAEEKERHRKEAEEARAKAEAAEAARAKAEAEKAEAEAKAAEERRQLEEKAEAERKKAEAKLQEEREKAARERAEAEAKAKAEREKAEAKLAAERKAIEAEREEARQKEQREKEAREQIERDEKELKAREVARLKEEAQRPDKDKLATFAGQVRELKLPKVATDEAKTVASDIEVQVEKFARWIEKQISNL